MNNVDEPRDHSAGAAGPKAAAGATASLNSPGRHAPDAAPAPNPPGPVTFRARTALIAGTAGAAVLLGALALGTRVRMHRSAWAAADMQELASPTVSVVSATLEKTQTGLTLPAEIRPWKEASIYARANGYLADWNVDIGAHVQAGQELATIDTPDLNQQLEQAKAQLALAQATLHLAEITDNRWQALLKSASVSEQAAAEKAAARETAAAGVEADRANMRHLEELVAFRRVVAPFDGTITLRNIDPGDLIVAGVGAKELFHIAQTDKLRVYVHVPETQARGIAAGQTATLTTPVNPGQSFEATVITTSEAISASSRTLLTEFEVDNPRNQILPYSYGELVFKDDNSGQTLVLPSNTLLFRAQGLQVGVVGPDGTVEMRTVQVGRDFGHSVEIRSGVTAADRVIANPSDSLVSGIKVRLADSSKTLSSQ